MKQPLAQIQMTLGSLVAGFALLIAFGCSTEPLDANGTSAALTSAEARQPLRRQASTPEAQGIDSVKLAEALLAIREQNIHVHSLLLARNGKVVSNAYFYPYDGTTVHDLASVTKSIMTTLIGIAIDRGALSLDDPMVSFFPDREIAHLSPLKRQITVRHLVSMTSGLACEKEPGEPTLAEMQASSDWIQFMLDREVVWEPGTYFVYCSPGTHVLSAILQQATGMTALDFARRYLFLPLGIRESIWPVDPQGYNTGWGELRIHPLDTAKLGVLWMNHGRWHGREVVSRAWVEESTQPMIETREGGFYGYGWWIETEPYSYRADGRGGQYVFVVPSFNVLLATAGGGFTLDQLEPLLVPLLSGANEPLTPNRAGVRQLRTSAAAVREAPAPEPVGPTPDTAAAISGRMFALAANPVGLQTFGLELPGGTEGVLHYKLAQSEELVAMPVGLDGVYRFAPGDYGLPEGARGYWSDDETFVLEYDEIANQGHIVLRVRYQPDHTTVAITDLSQGYLGEFEATALEVPRPQ